MHDLSQTERLRLMKFVCSFAWTDLKVTRQERNLIEKLLDAGDFSSADRDHVRAWLEVPPTAEEVDPYLVPRAHREQFLAAARAMVAADGRVVPAESDAIRFFEELLQLEHRPVAEARLERTAHGLQPASDGWFVVNVQDSAWHEHDVFGSWCRFEGAHKFPQLGINIHVLQPGQPACMYHRENQQEDFLVLSGTCLLIVEGQERPLKRWDFFHAAPGTEHVFAGAGDGPCVILMVGHRSPAVEIFYPRNDVALRHRAGVEVATPSPNEAYAAFGDSQPRQAPELP